MKKFLMIAGIVFICLIIVAVIGHFILRHMGKNFDKESKAYTDTAIRAMVLFWHPNELIDRASPELLKVSSKSEVERLFKACSKVFGPMKEYKGSKGESFTSITINNGMVVTAKYFAEVIFEKNSAIIELRLIKRNDQWQITFFYIRLDNLVNAMQDLK